MSKSVETTTASGRSIECTVVGEEGGELLLDSPEHGYIIRRRRSECRALIANRSSVTTDEVRERLGEG